jgi:hypothetical protein
VGYVLVVPTEAQRDPVTVVPGNSIRTCAFSRQTGRRRRSRWFAAAWASPKQYVVIQDVPADGENSE